jgi:hypothetical protein
MPHVLPQLPRSDGVTMCTGAGAGGAWLPHTNRIAELSGRDANKGHRSEVMLHNQCQTSAIATLQSLGILSGWSQHMDDVLGW